MNKQFKSKLYFSPRWFLFGTRPLSLLNREFRKDCYFYLESISSLHVSQLLVIGGKYFIAVYVKRNEDKRNYLQIKKVYVTKQVERNLGYFSKLVKNYTYPGKNVFEKALDAHRRFGPILVYSHYLERILTEKYQNYKYLTLRERRRVTNLIQKNNRFRDELIRIIDSYFTKAKGYLKRKYKLKNIEQYLLSELLSGKKLSQHELQSRKKFYVSIFKRKKSEVFTSRQALLFLKKENFSQQQIEKTKTIKGFIAQKGRVRGRVIIVRKLADFRKREKWDIVVSPMTVPQFTAYLKRAKAIVTDEGGVTCHAAIVSRELKIPCIVGTKIATKVLKDGDRVGVDATKGMVRKI